MKLWEWFLIGMACYVVIDSIRWWREQNRMKARLDELLRRMDEEGEFPYSQDEVEKELRQ
jgi:hypothetical protein